MVRATSISQYNRAIGGEPLSEMEVRRLHSTRVRTSTTSARTATEMPRDHGMNTDSSGPNPLLGHTSSIYSSCIHHRAA